MLCVVCCVVCGVSCVYCVVLCVRVWCVLCVLCDCVCGRGGGGAGQVATSYDVDCGVPSFTSIVRCVCGGEGFVLCTPPRYHCWTVGCLLFTFCGTQGEVAFQSRGVRVLFFACLATWKFAHARGCSVRMCA